MFIYSPIYPSYFARKPSPITDNIAPEQGEIVISVLFGGIYGSTGAAGLSTAIRPHDKIGTHGLMGI